MPGHDMDALAFHNPERRLLISGDALWRNGFGVIFSELLGNPEDAGAAFTTWSIGQRTTTASHGANK